MTTFKVLVKLRVHRFAGARVGLSVYPLAKLAISPAATMNVVVKFFLNLA